MKRIFIAGGLIAALSFGLYCPVLWPGSPQKSVAGQISAATIDKRLKGIHPVLNAYNRLIGGLVDGKWQNNEEVASRLTGKEVYRFYSRREKLGEASGPKVRKEFYLTGENGYFLDFDKFFPEQAFGICADWNPLPRVPEIRSNPDKYLPEVKDVLTQKKMPADNIQIREVLAVDLEGDGMIETIISATNVTEEDIDALYNSEGEEALDRCSLVLLLTGDGVPVLLAEKHEGIFEYEVPFVADVDGDGVMEIMVRELWLDTLPVEGFSLICESLLKVKGENIELLGEIDWHPV